MTPEKLKKFMTNLSNEFVKIGGKPNIWDDDFINYIHKQKPKTKNYLMPFFKHICLKRINLYKDIA